MSPSSEYCQSATQLDILYEANPITGDILYKFFYKAFLLLVLLLDLYVLEHKPSFYYFSWLESLLLYTCNTIFIHSPVFELLGYFYILVLFTVVI